MIFICDDTFISSAFAIYHTVVNSLEISELAMAKRFLNFGHCQMVNFEEFLAQEIEPESFFPRINYRLNYDEIELPPFSSYECNSDR